MRRETWISNRTWAFSSACGIIFYRRAGLHHREGALLTSESVILVVEDEPDLLQVLLTILETSVPNHRAVGFRTAEEARRFAVDLLASDGRLAMALVDESLGLDSGIELLAELEQHLPPFPAALITGQCSFELRDRATQLGVQVLAKPMRLKELVHVCRSTLASG